MEYSEKETMTVQEFADNVAEKAQQVADGEMTAEEFKNGCMESIKSIDTGEVENPIGGMGKEDKLELSEDDE